MACSRLRRTHTEASRRLQAHAEKGRIGPDSIRQSNIAIGLLAAIVRAVFDRSNLAARANMHGRQDLAASDQGDRRCS
jgi:hypothetical protein